MQQSTKLCLHCGVRPRNSYSSNCRECWNARCREYRKQHGSPKKKPQVNCSRCGQIRTGKHLSYCAPCFAAWKIERSTQCSRCGVARDRQDGASFAYCRRCQRDVWLRRERGISIDDYEAMLASQDSRCALCRKCENGRQWHVDHDHKTGRVRGILCDNCNRGIGQLGDDPNRLRRAASYIEGTLDDRTAGLPQGDPDQLQHRRH